ncbi:MAG: hypothetical protein WAS21_17855 [Geminicoccaceae bacterium]
MVFPEPGIGFLVLVAAATVAAVNGFFLSAFGFFASRLLRF